MACGGRTEGDDQVSGDFVRDESAGAGGSTAGAAGEKAGAGGSTAGAAGAAGAKAGAGGSTAGVAGAAGAKAGAGGSAGGAAGATMGMGGSSAGAAGATSSLACEDLPPPPSKVDCPSTGPTPGTMCEKRCFAAAGAPCLDPKAPALIEKLKSTVGPVCDPSSVLDSVFCEQSMGAPQCCYFASFVCEGRPLLVDGAPRTSALRRGAAWG